MELTPAGMESRVAVIIPLYQMAGCVGRALRSVLGQTLAASEVIVVDDGSSDGGGAIVERLGDSRVSLRHQIHAGAGAARNHGVSATSRELVAFLDADDEWAPTFLERTVALALRCPQAVAVFTNIEGRGSQPLLGVVRASGSIVDNYFESVLANAGVGMTSSSALIRRTALLGCGGFPEKAGSGEDQDTWARLAWSGPIGFVPECLAVYHPPDDYLRRSRPLCAPHLIGSFREWKQAGRIPPRLERASRALTAHALADFCVELAHVGEGPRARSLLRAGSHGLITSGLFLKPLIWSFCPVRVLRLLRERRNRGTRGLVPE